MCGLEYCQITIETTMAGRPFNTDIYGLIEVEKAYL